MKWRYWLGMALFFPMIAWAATVHVQSHLGPQATAIIQQLPFETEVIGHWPADDELWLHHDGSHLLAMELPLNQLQNTLKLFKTLDREFSYYALYRLRYHLLIVMSRARPIPWPKSRMFSTHFIGDQSWWQQLFALHDRSLRRIDLYQVGRLLPLHLLYPKINSSHYSHFTSPILPMGEWWSRLAMQVALGDREGMLHAAATLLAQQKSQGNFLQREYVLGIAMLANAMMQQYPSALLLWDKYEPGLFVHHQPALDMLLLRNYCLHRLSVSHVPKKR